MTRSSSKPCKSSSSKKSNEGCNYRRYLKPGALAKLRDSKIIATSHRQARISLANILSLSTNSPSSSSSSFTDDDREQSTPQQPLNLQQINYGFPCFASRIHLNRPRCLHRKKLFAVAPFFTDADEVI